MAEPGLSGVTPGSGRHQDAAGLGLPPGVDDRAAAVAHHVVVPPPGVGVDRFADRAEDAQRPAGVLRDPLVAGPDQGADRGRRGVEDVDPEVVDDLPVAAGVGIDRHRLEHDGGGAVGERTVDDVGVAGDPADVGGAEVDVAGVVVEDQLVGHRRVDHVAAGGVQHSLRLARRSRGVEDEQRVLRAHPLVGAGRALLAALLVEPEIATRPHRHLGVGASRHQHRLDQVEAVDGAVDGLLEVQAPPAAQTLVGGHHHPGPGVEDAIADRLRAEAAEDDRVHRADPCAGQHGVGELGDHRHVDAHPIALADAVVTAARWRPGSPRA